MKDFVFKKKFGQNFISDKNLLNAIASDAEICEKDEVLEIGAGAGSLTQILSEKAKHVVSFEIDRDLQEHLLGLDLKNVDFVFGDFMDFDMSKVAKTIKLLQICLTISRHQSSLGFWKSLKKLSH